MQVDTDHESDELDAMLAEDITVIIFYVLSHEFVAVEYTLDQEFGCRTISPKT